MKVIIPAAGEGTRLRPHTLTKSKPLLRLAGKRVIDYVIQPLLSLNPSEVIMVLGYRGEELEKYVRENYDFKLTTVNQRRLLGLGYAVHLALENVNSDEEIIILLADTIALADYDKFVTLGDNALGLMSADDPTRFGIATIEDGIVTALEEKPSQPKSNLALIGLYYFSSSAKLKHALSELVSAETMTAGEIQLTDALAKLISAGEKFYPFEVDNWLDSGKRETMLSTNGKLLTIAGATVTTENGNTYEGHVWQSPRAKVFDSKIGPNVSIYEESEIRNSRLTNCIVGAGARINNSKLHDSIIGDYSQVDHMSGCVDLGDYSTISAPSLN